MTARSDRWRKMRRAAGTLVVLALVYEAVARSGYFPAVLLPTLPGVARALVGLLSDGTLLIHAGYTLARVLSGFALAVAVGLPLGIAMARSRAVENFVMPLASALMPIPSLAWVPVFILWFGLGDAVTVAIVFYAALFPMLLNTWTGRARGQPAVAARRPGDGRRRARAVLEGDHPRRLATDHHRLAPSLHSIVDRGGRRRDARRVRLGTRLDDDVAPHSTDPAANSSARSDAAARPMAFVLAIMRNLMGRCAFGADPRSGAGRASAPAGDWTNGDGPIMRTSVSGARGRRGFRRTEARERQPAGVEPRDRFRLSRWKIGGSRSAA